MEENKFGIDPELISEFVDESEEMMSNCTNIFIVLEQDPGNKEAIDTVFRTVHTIKGNSAFFNLLKVKVLAHRMEDLMGLVREGKTAYSKSIANILIQGIDMLREMMERVRSKGPELENETSYEELIANISKTLDKERTKDQVSLWKSLINYLEEFTLKFKSTDAFLNGLILKINTAVKSLSPFDKEKKKEAPEGLSGVNPIEELKTIISDNFDEVISAEKAKRVLELLHAVRKTATPETERFAAEAVASYDSMVGIGGLTSTLCDLIMDKIALVKIKASDSQKSDPQAGADTEVKGVSVKNKTMRIAESNIDQFLDYVGDLVVVGEMYDHIHNRLVEAFGVGKAIADLKKNNDVFNTVSQSLQKSILEVRKVPIKTLLQRAPKIAHDVAVIHNKEIKVETSGEELNIDKSLLESLDGPFTHMVRNAADHGIETPDERKKNGKAPIGTIKIGAFEDEETMSIVIEDDGGGINIEAVKKKVIANGLASGDMVNQMKEEDLYQYLFAPGFSTAKVVTDISGRGVGMDVVKKNMDAIGGKIIIQSSYGKGARFELRFPKSVTVKIMNGFIVAVNNERFVLPMTVIGESFEISEQSINKSPDGGEFVLRHEKVYKVLRLNNILGWKESVSSDKPKIGVTVMIGNNTFITLVDELVGTSQVVVKDIKGLPCLSPIVAGGVILGDERVAIALNLEKL